MYNIQDDLFYEDTYKNVVGKFDFEGPAPDLHYDDFNAKFQEHYKLNPSKGPSATNVCTGDVEEASAPEGSSSTASTLTVTLAQQHRGNQTPRGKGANQKGTTDKKAQKEIEALKRKV